MVSRNFPHDYGFDPRYGYDLDGLLKLKAPSAPDGFTAFWQELYARALAMRPLPASLEIHSPVANLRLFEIEFDSLDSYLTISVAG
jgi:cephalosporin-C deacetylase